jgi:hypothetical protein
MNPPLGNPAIDPGKEDKSPPSRLQGVVRKSVLLNVVIVLTSAPVLIFAGGPKAVVPTLEIMTAISVLIWTATFSVLSFASLARIYWPPVSTLKRTTPPHPANGAGVGDRWLDGTA